MTKPGTLLTLGHGYCASALTRDLVGAGWRVLGTVRDANKGHALMDQGVEPILWTPKIVARALEQASHVLVSAGPEVEPKVGHKAGGAMGHDPSLALISDVLTRRAQDLRWVGYLSTTGVYGDANGDWVTESSPLHPGTKRGQARLAAETDWRAIPDLPLHIFRLAGIYGPGRGPFAKVRAGTARRIIKPGQVFSRIHVADIAQVLRASMARPNPGAAYNVCDDDPAPPQDVIAYAAELLGQPIPKAVTIDEVDLTPMARSFYAENKRVDNTRIKTELGIALQYPDYKTGLRAMAEAQDDKVAQGQQI